MIKVLLDVKKMTCDEINNIIQKNSILKNVFANGITVLEIENRFVKSEWWYTENVECDGRIYQIQEVISCLKGEKDLYKRMLVLDITEEV